MEKACWVTVQRKFSSAFCKRQRLGAPAVRETGSRGWHHGQNRQPPGRRTAVLDTARGETRDKVSAVFRGGTHFLKEYEKDSVKQANSNLQFIFLDPFPAFFHTRVIRPGYPGGLKSAVSFADWLGRVSSADWAHNGIRVNFCRTCILFAFLAHKWLPSFPAGLFNAPVIWV